MARLIKYLVAALSVTLPIVVLAQVSPNFRLQDGGLEASQHNSASANFRVIGALEPLTGESTSTNLRVRTGSILRDFCGNAIIDVGETCDGGSLGGQTCVTRGFIGGTLLCAGDCTAFNVAGCQSAGGGGGGGAPPSAVPPTPGFDPALGDSPLSFRTTFILSGTKATDATITVNGSSEGVTYPSSTTWQKVVTLVVGDNKFDIRAVTSGGTSPAKTINVNRRKSGDGNGDQVINDLDLSKLVGNWGTAMKELDFNGDGIVSDFDLSILVASWGL